MFKHLMKVFSEENPSILLERKLENALNESMSVDALSSWYSSDMINVLMSSVIIKDFNHLVVYRIDKGSSWRLFLHYQQPDPQLGVPRPVLVQGGQNPVQHCHWPTAATTSARAKRWRMTRGDTRPRFRRTSFTMHQKLDTASRLSVPSWIHNS